VVVAASVSRANRKASARKVSVPGARVRKGAADEGDPAKVDGEASFEELLSGVSPLARDIARAARSLIYAVMPDVTEVLWRQQGIAGYGIGPRKGSEHFCYIAPQKEYVNLGFLYGAELEDGAGLLAGTGKLFRHVKLKSLVDVSRPALRRLVEAASTHLPKLPSTHAQKPRGSARPAATPSAVAKKGSTRRRS
jgi:hypothetical protein